MPNQKTRLRRDAAASIGIRDARHVRHLCGMRIGPGRIPKHCLQRYAMLARYTFEGLGII